MSERILLLSKYGSLAGSSRYRFYQYLPYLKSQGFEISVAPFLSNEYIRSLNQGACVITNEYIQNVNRGNRNRQEIISAYFQRLQQSIAARNYDLIWLEKELLPYLPAWLERLLIGNIPYVVDYDDAQFHRYDRHPSKLVRALWGQKIDRVMAHARVVIAGNEYLACRARKAGASRVEIIPTTIDLDRYALKPPADINHSVFNIGWIGSPVTMYFLTELEPVFEEISSRYPTTFTFVGANDRLKFANIKPHILAWNEGTEVEQIASFDVGIMPLTDTPWTRGKCGIKLIQYMGCGLPVIGAPVGVNREIVEHGINGFHATTAQEWIDALTILAEDAQLRQRMGAKGRAMVAERYCLQVTAPKLAYILRSCAS